MSVPFRLPPDPGAAPYTKPDRAAARDYGQQCRDDERSQVVHYLRDLAYEAEEKGLSALAGHLFDLARRVCEGEHVEKRRNRT